MRVVYLPRLVENILEPSSTLVHHNKKNGLLESVGCSEKLTTLKFGFGHHPVKKKESQMFILKTKLFREFVLPL